MVGLLVCTFLLASTGLAQPSQAQDQPNQEVLVKYSLFYEYYKNKDYKNASPHLGWLLENAPTYRGDRNWERGVKLYEELAKAASDDKTKKAYLDSALTLYDKVVPTFEKAGKLEELDTSDWTFNRARFLQSHANIYRDRQDEVLTAYEEVYNSSKKLHSYYVRYIVDQYVKKGKKQKAIDFMEEAEEKYSDSPDLLSYFDDLRNDLFTSPEERIAFLEGQLKEDPENTELLSQLFDLYKQVDNMAKVEEIGNRLLELEPSVETHKLLADMKYSQGQYQESISHYESALNLAKNATAKRDINYEIAQVYKEQGNLRQARSYARAALKQDNKFADAYMLIANIYASAVQQSGSMEREDRAVYWLVLDYYERAKQVDPSVASRVNRAIETYREYIPAQEDLFFKNWKPGQSYKVDYGSYSWINETTTVRSPK